MADVLTLEFVCEAARRRRLSFDAPGGYVLGRSPDCDLRLPDLEPFANVSRRHCRIELDPPRVRVRDLGSLNGTYVNGDQITATKDAEKSRAESEWVALNDRDRVILGRMGFEILTAEAPVCRICQADLTGETDGRDQKAKGPLICAECGRNISEAAGAEVFPELAGRPQCFSCNRILPDPGGKVHQSRLCGDCRRNPEKLVDALTRMADSGLSDLAPLKGLQREKKLGQGATGAVFLLKSALNNERSALKLLLPQFAASEWVRESFLREIRNSAGLNHPNVVRTHGAGRYDDAVFYTMEFCDGGSLLDLLLDSDEGRLDVEEVLPLVMQALDGLEYIHNAPLPEAETAKEPGRGLVHRDLKPANIFLHQGDGERTAKIADVGVGKAYGLAGLSGLTRTGTVAGSPSTMPRQQAINFKYVQPEVDVWAMAATMYIMLTGRYPREFKESEDPFVTVLTTQPIPIRQRRPELPEALAWTIDDALVDDPEIKHKTAASLKKALEAVWP